MTKQEEIREGIAKIEVGNLWDMEDNRIGALCEIGKDGASRVIDYLHSQGVVIQVERELPEIPKFEYDHPQYRGLLQRGAINYSKLLAGYVPVEPLIEGK